MTIGGRCCLPRRHRRRYHLVKRGARSLRAEIFGAPNLVMFDVAFDPKTK